jgi:hypothetical protein
MASAKLIPLKDRRGRLHHNVYGSHGSGLKTRRAPQRRANSIPPRDSGYDGERDTRRAYPPRPAMTLSGSPTRIPCVAPQSHFSYDQWKTEGAAGLTLRFALAKALRRHSSPATKNCWLSSFVFVGFERGRCLGDGAKQYVDTRSAPPFKLGFLKPKSSQQPASRRHPL